MEHWTAMWAQAHTHIKQVAIGRKNSTARLCLINDVPGSALRLRLSNRDGRKPVTIIGCSAQRGAEPAVSLTFGSERTVTLAEGETRYSDPIPLALALGQMVTVSLCVSAFLSGNNPAEPVCHSQKGDYTLSPQFPAAGMDLNRMRYNVTPALPALASVEILTAAKPRTVVCFGDSITQNGRWVGPLREMLRRDGDGTVVLNMGIGGNRLLAGPAKGITLLGISALDRFAEDVLAVPGATDLILALGTNDLGNASDRAQLSGCGAEKQMAAFQALAAQARAAGMGVYLATITPRNGSACWTPAQEQERLRCNDQIRNAVGFDGILDFDRTLLDPAAPGSLAPCWDSGDHLHPGLLGGRAMAEVAYRVLTAKRE